MLRYIIIFFILFSGYANAYERPEFEDGLADKWHSGGFCIPCHYTLMSTEKAQTISKGCTCHDYRPKNVKDKYKINMNEIFDIHKDIVCIRCHVGIKTTNNVTAADFHRVMNKVACLSCHTYSNGTYQKPQKTACSECHGGDPHVIHDKRIGKMCVACHGTFGEKYTEKLPPEIRASLEKQNISTVRKYPSIGEFIIKIIQALL